MARAKKSSPAPGTPANPGAENSASEGASGKWSSRFSKSMDEALVDFNASIGFDQKLACEDVQGSLAHGKMLAKIGLLSQEEFRKIASALEKIREEIETGHFHFNKKDEDIHLNIERRLTELTGEIGKKIHTGRSRNDQVALDTRLYVRKAIDTLLDTLGEFQESLIKKAERHLDFIMPGFTHLQHAQPVCLSHHLLAYFEMFDRDRQRLKNARTRCNILPLGSGALAGSTLPLDRNFVAKELDFDGVSRNSLDAVSDRDYVLEFTFACSVTMMHLSRMCEEWILWASSEFRFIDIDDSLCTGSSMMPQKKNPDIPELVRGKSARTFGHLMTLLALTKGLPLAYNKDLQEDKEPLFDTFETTQNCLFMMNKVLLGTTFNKDFMFEAANEPLILATDLAEYLVKKGVPFRTAHDIVGKTVRYCLEHHKRLQELTLTEFLAISDRYEKDVLAILNLETSVDQRLTIGGTARSCIQAEIRDAKGRLKK